jgi:hypothetical protein
MTDTLGPFALTLGYDPNVYRFGVEDPSTFFVQKTSARTLLQGRARMVQLYLEYFSSYQQSSYTVLAYRDLILSLAIAAAIRCTQTRDSTYTELTTTAQRYWTTYGANFWPSVSAPGNGFYGLCGSVAFSMYTHSDGGNGLYVTQVLRKALNYFWADLGIDATLTPAGKQRAVFNKLQVSPPLAITYTALLNGLAAGTLNSTAPDLARLFNQSLVVPDDWQMLFQRLVLGEITDELIEVLTVYTNSTAAAQYKLVGLPTAQQIINNGLALCPPAGVPLIYQALALDGLLTAAEYLTSTVSDDIINAPFVVFQTAGVYESDRTAIATALSTAYDAYAALGLFNTLYEASGLSYRIFLTAAQLLQHNQNPVIPKVGPSRLSEFMP